tara:strand:- start:68 stop:2284 length:2217 start_codon:yes stop_codon:yes gene_type:complete
MINIAGYKILKEIGSGGMGVVYLAKHEKLRRKVAIKSLHKNLVNDIDFRKRFSNEAITHSKLNHPNIVKLLDFIENDDGLYLIMEYVEGIQIDEHIKKVSGPIPENELIILFIKILSAIGYAHNQGLVHRDIKPSNVMISKEGEIKLLDFGIAKSNDDEKGLTKTGVQIGTAAYMSPEQVGAKKLDYLTDIYSLGVTLFYMAVGKSPYDGDTNTFDIQNKIINDAIPKATKIYPGVSPKIEEVIKKATHKKKKSRYQSCDEFTSALTSEYKVENEEVLETKTNTSLISRFIYPICILFFVLLYFVTAKIDNNTDQPNYFLSEYSLIAGLFLLISIFSYRTLSIKRKIKKIISREIIYLISGLTIAFIMFNFHSKTFIEENEIRDHINNVRDEYFDKSEKLSVEDYSSEELVNLGFIPINKTSFYSDFIYTLQKNIKTNSQGIKYFDNWTYKKLSRHENKRYLEKLGKITKLSSITENNSNSIYFDIDGYNNRISMDRDLFVIGDLKLKKKKPIYEKIFRTFNVGSSKTSFNKLKSQLKNLIGNDINESTHFDNSFSSYIYSMDIGAEGSYTYEYISDSDKYGLCYWDKKEKKFVRTKYRTGYEKKFYGTTGLGCGTYLCVSKKIRDDYYLDYSPSNSYLFVENPILEKNNNRKLEDLDDKDLYQEINFITLKKNTKGIINPKLDKIEVSLFASIEPSFLNNNGVFYHDWAFLFLIYGYIFRIIISLIIPLFIWIKRNN